MTDISIVVSVNKKDLWFCRICIASIRYYYPDVPIYLLIDELNGKFSVSELIKLWNIQIIKYPRKKFGWSASKIHFYCDQRFIGRKFLVIDADIVFVGKVLDHPFLQSFNEDVIVNVEKIIDPYSEWFSKTYFNFENIKIIDPDFNFEGYAFNCGQLFCKGAFLSKEIIDPYFYFDRYPPWKKIIDFPLVDQSVFNYLLPKLTQTSSFKIGKQQYMLWSESNEVKTITIDSVRNANAEKYLVHWAGALRTPNLIKMTRCDILLFFESYYYSKIKFGKILLKCRKYNFYMDSFLNRLVMKLNTTFELILKFH